MYGKAMYPYSFPMSIMTTVTGRVPSWTFADRIRKARIEMSLTQAQFAERIHAKEPAYAQWEAGNAKPRNLIEVARRIEQVTGISAAWLLGLTEPSDGGSNLETLRSLDECKDHVNLRLVA